MNLFRRTNLTFACALLALLLSSNIGTPVAYAADEPADANDISEQRTVLETDLFRLYGLIQQDVDPTTKTTLLGHHRELANRANRLLEKFDSAKYDELRYDINIQCQRLARKQAPLLSPPVEEHAATIPEFAVDELNPSPGDKAEVKAALDVVDLTLKRLSARLATLTPRSAQHISEQARIQRVKEHRAALGKEFTQARWEAFAREMK